MVNLNNSQINALTSFIYTKAAEAAKKRIDEQKKILLRNTLNNSSFITAFKEFNEATKKAEKLRREAGKLLESARDNFRKKFPFDYLGDLNTLETAANSHVNYTIFQKEKPVRKSDIKEMVILYSIDASDVENIKNNILRSYDEKE